MILGWPQGRGGERAKRGGGGVIEGLGRRRVHTGEGATT